MAWTVMYDVMQWVDGNGDPASGYVIKAYEPGTTTPISIAIDKNGGSPQATVTLNSEGKPEVSGNEVMLFIDRDYKWAIFRNASDAAANSNPYAGFYDNIPQNVFENIDVDDYAALRAINSSQLSDGESITVTNQGIGGLFAVRTGTVTDNGGTLIVFTDDSNRYAERITENKNAINIEWFGVSTLISDNTSSILAAFNYAEANGSEIHLGDVYGYTTPITLDTSTNSGHVTFKGIGTRVSGFRYEGSDDAVNAAFQIGVDGVSSSGFVQMLYLGIYGQNQDIDAVRIYSGQRYCVLDEFLVRSFNGMLLDVGEGDIFLNTWGAIYLLNGCRACSFGPEFNSNSVSNVTIENMTLTSARYASTVPTCFISGIGTSFDVFSVESCDQDMTLDVEKQITIQSLYFESNHTAPGTNCTDIKISGIGTRILGGNNKLPGFSPNQSGYYIFDLNDSDGAEVNLNVTVPTLNPNAYQKPVNWGTSKNSNINCIWEIFNGVTYPSRTESTAFAGEIKENYTLDGVPMIFGQHPEVVGRELMTKYCLNESVGRCLYPNSSNRVDGFTESNLNSSSKLVNTFGFSNRKDVLMLSAAAAGDYGVYEDFSLDSTHKYLFTSFLGRKDGDLSTPKIRVIDIAGSQDYTITPRVNDFRGWTQVSVITDLLNATNVRFWSLTADNNTGQTYLAASFLIDLTAYEEDHGVSFSGMTTRQVEALIKPSYIAEEFNSNFRAGAPTYGVYNRGHIVYRYPPTSGQPAGYICSVSGDFDATPPTFLAMANLT